MKGVIFNMLEEFVIEVADEQTFENILEECNFVTEGPFVGPGTYPDADFMEMANKAIATLGLPTNVALRAFGKWSFVKLAEKVPPSFVDFEHPKVFLLTIESTIHAEVRKLYINANPPRFEFEDLGPNELIIYYISDRHLPDLMDGLIEGVSDHFKTEIKVSREEFQRDGHSVWKFYLTFGERN
ncbi:MAG: hypothetical protein ACI906_004527 [Candidatus Latescibacterota bacterium]|jgi:hypothetical protein